MRFILCDILKARFYGHLDHIGPYLSLTRIFIPDIKTFNHLYILIYVHLGMSWLVDYEQVYTLHIKPPQVKARCNRISFDRCFTTYSRILLL